METPTSKKTDETFPERSTATVRRQRQPTNGHHVVPAVQEAQAEPLAVGRQAHVDQGPAPVHVLEGGQGPGHQEPAHNEQDDPQQAKDSPAGHVGDPLGGPRQEHLQNPAAPPKGRTLG